MRKFFIVASVFIIILGICFGAHIYLFAMKPLPYSTRMCESVSPEGTYTVRAYLSSPALSSSSVWCELIIGNRKPKVFYVGYREEDAEIIWFTDNEVVINGHRLVLPDGVYNWRDN